VVFGEGIVVGLGGKIDFDELYVATWDKVARLMRTLLGIWYIDLPVNTSGKIWPTLNTEGHQPAMNVVERLGEGPRLFYIIDEELDIRRNTCSH
jgi:hypothetical protein